MTGTAVEQVEAQDLAHRRHLNRVIATADVMAASSLCRKDLRGKPEDVRAIAITLDQMGIPPGIMNINAGFVVNGRVDFMTRIWTALAQRGGYRVWPDDDSDAQAGIAWIRDVATGEEHRVTFTWEDAAKAGLTGSDTYKKYGRDMLIWRAMARAVRWHAPEVVAGMVEFDDTPVARPRPRPIPEPAAGRHYPETDDGDGCDVFDAEIVEPEQGEDPGITPAQVPEGAESRAHTGAASVPAHPGGGVSPNDPAAPSGHDEQPEVYNNRRRRANAVMGEVGVKSDDARHQLVHTATGGATSSTGRLTAWQVDAVIDFCDRLKLEEGLAGAGENGGPAAVVDGSTAPSPPRLARAELLASAAEQGIPEGRLLMLAREVAPLLGLELPATIDQLVDEALIGALAERIG